MREACPKVYLIAETTINSEAVGQYLEDIGDPDWHLDGRQNDGDQLVELAGRMCYRSWQPWDPKKPDCSNANVGKVREGNRKYVGNILQSKHGSVLEHVNMTFIVRDCSRVLTHELVRHRAGMAYSQESLRYVRLTDLKIMIPKEIRDNGSPEEFKRMVAELERIQADLQEMFQIDEITDFALKKKLTSMFRRLAPIGLATSILFTANARALRHIIQMRTSASAEREIRQLFVSISRLAEGSAPNIFQDMVISDPIDGLPEIRFGSEKV